MSKKPNGKKAPPAPSAPPLFPQPYAARPKPKLALNLTDIPTGTIGVIEDIDVDVPMLEEARMYELKASAERFNARKDGPNRLHRFSVIYQPPRDGAGGGPRRKRGLGTDGGLSPNSSRAITPPLSINASRPITPSSTMGLQTAASMASSKNLLLSSSGTFSNNTTLVGNNSSAAQAAAAAAAAANNSNAAAAAAMAANALKVRMNKIMEGYSSSELNLVKVAAFYKHIHGVTLRVHEEISRNTGINPAEVAYVESRISSAFTAMHMERQREEANAAIEREKEREMMLAAAAAAAAAAAMNNNSNFDCAASVASTTNTNATSNTTNTNRKGGSGLGRSTGSNSTTAAGGGRSAVGSSISGSSPLGGGGITLANISSLSGTGSAAAGSTTSPRNANANANSNDPLALAKAKESQLLRQLASRIPVDVPAVVLLVFVLYCASSEDFEALIPRDDEAEEAAAERMLEGSGSGNMSGVSFSAAAGGGGADGGPPPPPSEADVKRQKLRSWLMQAVRAAEKIKAKKTEDAMQSGGAAAAAATADGSNVTLTIPGSSGGATAAAAPVGGLSSSANFQLARSLDELRIALQSGTTTADDIIGRWCGTLAVLVSAVAFYTTPPAPTIQIVSPAVSRPSSASTMANNTNAGAADPLTMSRSGAGAAGASTMSATSIASTTAPLTHNTTANGGGAAASGRTTAASSLLLGAGMAAAANPNSSSSASARNSISGAPSSSTHSGGGARKRSNAASNSSPALSAASTAVPPVVPNGNSSAAAGGHIVPPTLMGSSTAVVADGSASPSPHSNVVDADTFASSIAVSGGSPLAAPTAAATGRKRGPSLGATGNLDRSSARSNSVMSDGAHTTTNGAAGAHRTTSNSKTRADSHHHAHSTASTSNAAAATPKIDLITVSYRVTCPTTAVAMEQLRIATQQVWQNKFQPPLCCPLTAASSSSAPSSSSASSALPPIGPSAAALLASAAPAPSTCSSSLIPHTLAKPLRRKFGVEPSLLIQSTDASPAERINAVFEGWHTVLAANEQPTSAGAAADGSGKGGARGGSANGKKKPPPKSAGGKGGKRKKDEPVPMTPEEEQLYIAGLPTAYTVEVTVRPTNAIPMGWFSNHGGEEEYLLSPLLRYRLKDIDVQHMRLSVYADHVKDVEPITEVQYTSAVFGPVYPLMVAQQKAAEAAAAAALAAAGGGPNTSGGAASLARGGGAAGRKRSVSPAPAKGRAATSPSPGRKKGAATPGQKDLLSGTQNGAEGAAANAQQQQQGPEAFEVIPTQFFATVIDDARKASQVANRMVHRLVEEFIQPHHCHKHASQRYNYFCQTCREFICNSCAREMHANHSMSPLKQFCTAEINRMHPKVDALKRRINRLKDIIGALEPKSAALHDLIDNGIDGVATTLERHRATLHDDADMRGNNQLRQILHERARCAEEQSRIAEAVEVVRSGVLKGAIPKPLVAAEYFQITNQLALQLPSHDIRKLITVLTWSNPSKYLTTTIYPPPPPTVVESPVGTK